MNSGVHHPNCLQECGALVFLHGHIPSTVKNTHSFQQKPNLFNPFPPYLERISPLVVSLFRMTFLGLLHLALVRTNFASIMACAGNGVPRSGSFHVWIPTTAASTFESNANSRRSAHFVSLQTKTTDGTRSAHPGERDGSDRSSSPPKEAMDGYDESWESLACLSPVRPASTVVSRCEGRWR